MDICIGGPWHRCKLLGQSNDHEKFFKIKDNKSKVVSTYNKKIINVRDVSYVFWVCDELMEIESHKIIKDYLHEKFIFMD
ncbi:hypothetical protein [Acinetobacter guillouiae]|uniref:hypothetical protein n=1 Tax=Acinetobacter guillouiae TaxID=106649 RepID=UPI002FDB0FB8